MLKIVEKKRLETLPMLMNTPIEDVHKFIDQFFHDLWKVSGRTTDTIRRAHATRASV
jgi:hypothetical protein